MTATQAAPVQKTVQSINFLFFRTETTLAELGNFFGIAPQLYAEATALKLPITGPIHWHYLGFMGDVTKPFTLEIALPVAEIPNDYDGAFHFKRSESFACISLIHEGAWLEMTDSYGMLMEYCAQNQLTPAGVNRELYINVDFTHPEANTTEIQLGIL
jgi:effector-binding domain-containing protein